MVFLKNYLRQWNLDFYDCFVPSESFLDLDWGSRLDTGGLNNNAQSCLMIVFTFLFAYFSHALQLQIFFFLCNWYLKTSLPFSFIKISCHLGLRTQKNILTRILSSQSDSVLLNLKLPFHSGYQVNVWTNQKLVPFFLPCEHTGMRKTNQVFVAFSFMFFPMLLMQWKAVRDVRYYLSNP